MALAARAAVLLATGGLLLALQLRLRGDADIRTQVVGQSIAFALYVPAAFLCWRGLRLGRLGLVVVLLFAIGFRAAAFEPSAPPPLSTDVHRYAWDARVHANGVNPYRYSPASLKLERLRDDVIWPDINHLTWKTVYPPGAEASFLAARGVFGNGLRATTWLFLAAEGLAVLLLLLVLARARMPLERVMLYVWHPLAVSEIAANGHVDAVAVLAAAGVLAAWQARRFTLAGTAVAVGALVKLGPGLLVPALARRGGRRFVFAAVVVASLAYVPYLSVGPAAVGSLSRYVEELHGGASLNWLLDLWLGRPATSVLLGLVLAGIVAVVAAREHESLEQVARSGLLVLGGLLLVLGYVQPWHALWLLPFMVIAVTPGWMWVTGTLPLVYLYVPGSGLPDWVRPVVYLPLGLWVLLRLLARRRRQPIELSSLPLHPRVAAVIPVLNEVDSLPHVLREFPPGVVDEVIVVDGGSSDGTADAARREGARVVVEARRGYGWACATGASSTDADVLVFLDGDGSDDPAALADVLRPVLEGRAGLSLAARAESEPGALLLHQRLGNRLVALLIGLIHGVPLRDVPPMRAVRRDALEGLSMREMTYAWPTEMIIKTARARLPIVEVEVRSRARRGGESKIAGRLWPSARAGALMLATVARHT